MKVSVTRPIFLCIPTKGAVNVCIQIHELFIVTLSLTIKDGQWISKLEWMIWWFLIHLLYLSFEAPKCLKSFPEQTLERQGQKCSIWWTPKSQCNTCVGNECLQGWMGADLNRQCSFMTFQPNSVSVTCAKIIQIVKCNPLFFKIGILLSYDSIYTMHAVCLVIYSCTKCTIYNVLLFNSKCLIFTPTP